MISKRLFFLFLISTFNFFYASRIGCTAEITLPETEDAFKKRNMTDAELLHHVICCTQRTDLIPKLAQWGCTMNALNALGHTPLTTLATSPFSIAGNTRLLHRRIKFVTPLMQAGATLTIASQPLASCFEDTDMDRSALAPFILQQRIATEKKSLQESRARLRSERKNLFMRKYHQTNILSTLNNLSDLHQMNLAMQKASGLGTQEYKQLEANNLEQLDHQAKR